MPARFRDYYEILEVPRTATEAQIKEAYRCLARKHHPDLHPEAEKDQHTRRMQEINEAYSVLGSKESRAKYDQFGEHWQEGPVPPPAGERGQRPSAAQEEAFSDFFREMFRQAAARGGEARDFYPSELDIEADVELSLEESIQGVQKTFRLMTTSLCTQCRGTGRQGKALCSVCGGLGEIRRPREIKAKIPAGLLEGARIRLKGQGNEGPKERGDLYLTIHLRPDARFHVEGKNLETVLRLMPWQAALGSEASVPSLEGPVRVRIPKGTHTGKRLRLAGKGLGKPGERADLYILIEIDIPDHLSPQTEALFRQMGEETHG
jgi:curved DNA-binding protein